MSLAASRSRWLVPLLVVALTAFALAPRFAIAHGGHVDEERSAPADAGRFSGAVADTAANRSVSGGWSRPCPGGPAGACCCSSRPASTGSGKTPLAHSSGWSRPIASPRGTPNPALPEPLLQSQFTRSVARPRAPPFLS